MAPEVYPTDQDLYNFNLHYYLAFTNPAATSNGNFRILTEMDYDPMGRLLQTYKTINDQDSTKRLLSQNAYDALGQLKQKQLGQLPTDGSFLETQAYSYNIRGWLKGINKDYANNVSSNNWFGMELNYDWGFAGNQLNGNIAGEKWRSKGDGEQRAYGFGYDPVNRLLYGDFSQNDGSGYADNSKVNFDVIMGDGATAGSAYDENGNILFMRQYGLKLSGSSLIDSLSYTYIPTTNKLQNVLDGDNDATTTLGDFRTSANSPNANGGTKLATAVDYNYDVNGNLTRDLNKDIGTLTTDGIVYNHLNLPWQVTMQAASGQGVGGVKGTITYIYDAAGNKLEKRVVDNSNASTPGVSTITDYMGAFQYSNDTLKFFGQEEGRVRLKLDTTNNIPATHFEYDYFIKDHLGNTREVLTDEQETDMYPAATMETAQAATEDLYYSQVDATRTALPAGYPSDTTTNPNAYAAKVNGSAGANHIGPGITLKVMAGDQFNLKVSSWYNTNGTTPDNSTMNLPATDLVTALIAGVGGLPAGNLDGTATQLQGIATSILDPQALDFLNNQYDNSNASKPLAYVNWVLFDDQMNYVSSSSGFEQVGDNNVLTPVVKNNMPIDHNGYLYIYVNNETPNVDVYFDNLQVTVIRGPLTEENHYYPFGLTMAGISDKALKTNYAQNKYMYNRKELQSKEFSDGTGLEEYDYGSRMYDPQIGRFHQMDPLADIYFNWTPYSYVGDNPLKFIDPTGAKWDSASQAMVDQAVTAANAQINALNSEISAINKSATNKDGKVNLTKAQKSVIDEMNSRVGELSGSVTEIKAMGDDKDYTFSLSAQTGAYAELPNPAADNLKSITINFINGDIGNELHEIKHGYQVLKGDIVFSTDANGNVNASLGKGVSSTMDLEVPAYQKQYSYLGTLTGWQAPASGTYQAAMNQVGGFTGTPNQINTHYEITNHTQITATFVKTIADGAVGKPMY